MLKLIWSSTVFVLLQYSHYCNILDLVSRMTMFLIVVPGSEIGITWQYDLQWCPQAPSLIALYISLRCKMLRISHLQLETRVASYGGRVPTHCGHFPRLGNHHHDMRLSNLVLVRNWQGCTKFKIINWNNSYVWTKELSVLQSIYLNVDAEVWRRVRGGCDWSWK